MIEISSSSAGVKVERNKNESNKWSIDWLNGLFYWLLNDWFGRLIDWLIDRSIGGLIIESIDWLNDWLIARSWIGDLSLAFLVVIESYYYGFLSIL